MPAATTPQDQQRSAPAPAINEEADKALMRIFIRYAIIAGVVALVMMTLCGFVYARFPHNRLFAPTGPVYTLSMFLCFATFYFGQHKQASMRMEFARRYVAEQRWAEAAAALVSFASFGQRSLDRSGEAHYLLAQAYERLGKKREAANIRAWVVKHRAGSQWAQKIAPPAAAPPQHFRRKAAMKPLDAETAGVGAGTTTRRKPMPGKQARARRRRF